MKRTAKVGVVGVVGVWVLGVWVLALSACTVRPSAPGDTQGATPRGSGPTSAGPLDPSALREQLRSAAASLTPTRGVVPTPSVTGIDPALAPHIAVATADLASRLGVSPAAIEVVAAGVVTWPNAALGCPRPGMAYADQVVDGSLVVLRSGDRDYRYHAGGRTNPFLCQD
jgi:hypothetical protein